MSKRSRLVKGSAGRDKTRLKFFKPEEKSGGISSSDFASYVNVQKSGMTNMFDVKAVSQLSGLSIDEVKAIMNKYDELSEKYPEVVS